MIRKKIAHGLSRLARKIAPDEPLTLVIPGGPLLDLSNPKTEEQLSRALEGLPRRDDD